MAGAPLRIPLEKFWTRLRKADATAKVHVEVMGAFTRLKWALAAAVCLGPEKSGFAYLRQALAAAVYLIPVGWVIIYENFAAALWRTYALASLVVEYLFTAVTWSADAAACFDVEIVIGWAYLAKADTIAKL